MTATLSRLALLQAHAARIAAEEARSKRAARKSYNAARRAKRAALRAVRPATPREYVKPPRYVGSCERCGAEYRGRSKLQRFCTLGCKTAARTERRNLVRVRLPRLWVRVGRVMWRGVA